MLSLLQRLRHPFNYHFLTLPINLALYSIGFVPTRLTYYNCLLRHIHNTSGRCDGEDWEGGVFGLDLVVTCVVKFVVVYWD